ncbi:(Fe-S)-binding protein [Pseudolysobacter antarcticus]|uniref:Glycolate oxidase iron-sulfur subunit n=1 Tax=Pseudolysobacter antarcticus TaxID=2511995 RepID=A0A411HFT2_9GAMM|nr:(Fe-S)-binding protein [Pseudolysobacter antarcticus]QBB69331.1 (Fe-S)-binding protein [Pseudolysobacter antarcticus]
MALASTPESKIANGLRQHILQLADQCVMCGLCIPQCPTYRIGRQENESPRGRIALARGLASGELAPTPTLLGHIDHCLGCMSCENACPSEVDYAGLLLATRELQREIQPLSWTRRWLLATLAQRGKLNFLLQLGRIPGVLALLRSRLGQAFFKRAGIPALAHELPPLPAPRAWPAIIAPTFRSRGRIGLFLGCVASVFDQDTHAASITLLAALGYEVVMPRAQSCCGALARHAGLPSDASATRQAFLDAGVDTVLVSASGCFGSLRDSVSADSKIRVREIHEFIAADPELDRLQFKPLPQIAALHTPCTQTNVAKGQIAIGALLARIPALRIMPLPSEPRCCGAAGSYFLEQPQIAAPLRSEKLQQTLALTPDVLLTSNIGCRIYLGNGLRQHSETLPVRHPLSLLAQQLDV